MSNQKYHTFVEYPLAITAENDEIMNLEPTVTGFNQCSTFRNTCMERRNKYILLSSVIHTVSAVVIHILTKASRSMGRRIYADAPIQCISYFANEFPEVSQPQKLMETDGN